MSAEPRRRRQKTFASRMPAPAAARSRAARAPSRASTRPIVDPAALRPSDRGRPLEPAVRRRLEESLHRRLSHVRVHAEPGDRERAHAMGARAFAHRHHIWLGRHESPHDVRVIAHEVAHVAQQGFAPVATQGERGAAPPGAAVHPVAPRGGFGVSRPVAAPAPVARAAAPAVQRLDLDLFGRARRAASAVGSGIRSAGRAVAAGARAVGGAIVEAGENLLEMGRDALLAVVRRVAPDFVPLFEGDGIAGFVRRLVERGLRSMFDGLLGPLRGVINFDALGARVTEALSWIGTIAGQLGRNDCSGILAAARRVSDFFTRALDPVVKKIRSIADKVSGFFRSVWDSIGAPLWDMLKRIGGRIWESLKGFVRDVGAVIRRVREALGSAWNRVKGWFGIGAESGEEEGGGLWEWIKSKAASVGESISSVVRPIMGPLRDVAGVLLLMVPGGQVLGIMLLWPRLKQAWSWLSAKWTELNLIPRARHFLAHTVLPMLMDAAESVGQALVGAADWLLGLVQRIARGLATVLRAATGLLSPLGRVIGFVHEKFQAMLTWARTGLRNVSRNMRSLLQRLVRFLGVVLEAMQQLIAIVVNPFGIVGFLAGTIWRLIPECLKGPIIDFILDVIIRVLRALPPMPTLGLLWPVIKAAALGFLEKVRSFTIARKVNVSNKMARIVSGMSPSFAFGYLKGLALGVWEGITAPFVAIATIFDLPEMIRNFLSNLGIRLCELIESIRCFAANLVGRVFGTLDDILRGLGELLENPSRIVDLIRCAIEGVLSGARTLGGTIADQMMALFEGPDEAIGEQLGRLTGSALVQAVISYFTAGAGAALGVIRQISSVLGTVGRALGQVVRMLSQLLGRLVGFLRGLASRFASAAARGARSVLGRLGGFFRRVSAWFGRLLRRIFRGLRRRLALSPAQRAMWIQFRGRVAAETRSHPNGVTRQRLRTIYRGILNGFRPVAKWPAFITKHRQNWRLWVRRVKSIRPRRVGQVLLDPRTRLHQAMKEVKRVVTRLKRRPGILGIGEINRAMPPIQRRYHLRSLRAEWDRRRGKFHMHGVANPPGDWSTNPERPPRNEVTTRIPHRAVTVNPLAKLHVYSPPRSWQAWEHISHIKTVRTGTHAVYVRGHLAHGRFAPGEPWNLAAITRSANAEMRQQAEGVVIPKLRRRTKRPVFKYEVTTTPAAPGIPRYRKIQGVCREVPQEQELVRSITVRFTEYGFSGERWDIEEDRKTDEIPNVPQYPAGHGEPCTPPGGGS